jgi:hypothetical protein
MTTLQWVKALKMPPSENTVVCFRSNGMLFTGLYNDHTKRFKDVMGGEFPLRLVEWLLETESLPSIEGEELLAFLKGLLRDFINCRTGECIRKLDDFILRLQSPSPLLPVKEEENSNKH